MAKHYHTSLLRVAAMTLAAHGYTFNAHWQVGNENPYLIFRDNITNQAYSLEYGGGDNPYLPVMVYDFDAQLAYETDESEEESDDNPYKPPIWQLELEGSDLSLLSIGNEVGGEDMGEWSDSQLLLWAIGAIPVFIYEMQGGKLNG